MKIKRRFKMNKCENCIHFDMCADLHAYYHKVDKEKVIPFMVDKNSEELNFDHFKDKSLMVELPVKVGQVVYRIISYGNSRNQIIGHEIEANQVIEVYYREEIESKEFGKNIELTFNTTYADEYTKSDIGELVYLTEKDAEAKLKEIEGK
jgi:hypothetical protein